MATLLRWLFLWPFYLVRALMRRGFLLFRGYDSLVITLEGSLPDVASAPGLGARIAGAPRATALLVVLAALRRAERDTKLKRVVVRLRELHCGLARAQELSAALRRVANAGKAVIAVADELGLGGYVIALGASRIVLSPPGHLAVTGVAAELTFFRGLLDHVGVRAHMEARGEYKSAREPFTETAPSEANLEMTRSLTDDLYEGLIETIAERRGLPADDVKTTVDRGPFRAEPARAAGLIDDVAYADCVVTELEEGERWKPLRLERYLALTGKLAGRGKRKRIAILPVTGQIKTGRSSMGADGQRTTGSLSFLRATERLRKDSHVDAVVLRVSSPGGSAVASDLMWRGVQRLAEEKPVVVSMADVAASGGYYVSAVRGVKIFANPATITGSIGVVGGQLDLRALYDKLGITKTIVKRGKRAAHTSTYLAPSDEDRARTRQDIDALYDQFVEKMADGRGMSVTDLDAVARGRVWTGRQARGQGLVDENAGIMGAFEHLREILGIGAEGRLEAQFARTAPKPSLRALLTGGDADERLLGALPSALAESLALAREFEHEPALAILPFRIRIG